MAQPIDPPDPEAVVPGSSQLDRRRFLGSAEQRGADGGIARTVSVVVWQQPFAI